MRGWMPSGVVVILAWAAMGVCLAELIERRGLVISALQESVSGWMEEKVPGGKSHVSERRDEFGQ
ncbi:MAG: hypothetical protein HZB13_11340 [Acidobacteria bacterium]|nr:hypothetical protein [Acidobacteriota bacterium]